MKKQKAIITMALLGFALAACNKNETPANTGGGGATPAPAVSVETQMRQAYGFAAQIPADVASYGSFYQLGKLWDDLKGSKTWASVRANPMVAKALDNESFQQTMSQFNSNPDAAKWKAILKDALGNEAFIAFAPGSEADFHELMKLNGDVRMARLEALMTGDVAEANNPRIYMATVLPELKDLHCPPMILGFKMSSQKAALDAELVQAETNVPPFVEKGAFTLDGNLQFKSMAVTLSKALTPDQQENFKTMLETFITDPQVADATYQSLIARRLEIAYGYSGDYFIVSIGPDHSHLKFAANYADSLIARPEVQKAADYAGKPVLSFSWGSQQMMAACQQDFELAATFDEAKPELAGTLSQADMEKLEGDLKRIDTEGKALFNPPVTAMMGVEYRDHGLHGEMFGGMKHGAPGATMKFSQVPPDSTFLWVDKVADPAFNEAARVWFEDLASTAYDTFVRVGVPRMPEGERQGFAMMQALWVPKIVELYKITRDQFAKSLGMEKALAMDLNGEFPDIPVAPPEFHAGGKIMRLAYLSDLKDRALLGQSWTSYFNLLSELAKMAPGENFADGLPQPVSENVDGVALWYYKLPIPPGDTLPNVAVTDKTFVASLSRSYSLELSKAAAAASAEKPITLDVRLNFAPAYDLAEKWLALAVQDPELFFSDSEEEAADFKKSAPDIQSLIESLRVFDGMSVQAYEEDGVPRVSSFVRWNEK